MLCKSSTHPYWSLKPMILALAFSIPLHPISTFAKSFVISSNIEDQVQHSIDVKVPVQLGVMSRCPDALICESIFDRLLPNVTAKVDLSLIYIANVDEGEPTFGVRCKHGIKECAGNVQQLCVKRYASFWTWWGFVRCQNAAGKEKIGSRHLALDCAKRIGLQWEGSGVGSCAGSDASGEAPEGVALLQESVKLSQQLGVRKSCTILINGKSVCVHDGGWKDCKGGHEPEDFVRQIEDEYGHLNNATVYE